MDIGYAVQAMREGARVRRVGWNGKGMWVFLLPELPAGKSGEKDTSRPWPEFVAMKTAQGTVVPWVCSQSDLLADDWEIVSD